MTVFNECEDSPHSGLSVAVYIKLRAACHDLACICPSGGVSVMEEKDEKRTDIDRYGRKGGFPK